MCCRIDVDGDAVENRRTYNPLGSVAVDHQRTGVPADVEAISGGVHVAVRVLDSTFGDDRAVDQKSRATTFARPNAVVVESEPDGVATRGQCFGRFDGVVVVIDPVVAIRRNAHIGRQTTRMCL